MWSDIAILNFESRKFSCSNFFPKTIMKKLTLLVAATLFATLGAAPASAQDLDQAAFNNAMITRSQIIHNTGGALDPLSVRDRYIKRGGKAGTRTSRPKPRGSTRFRTSSATRRSLLASMVSKARAANPTAATALQRDFAKGDPIAAIAPVLARYGLRTDDVADSMAAYLVSSWYGVRGSNQNPTRAQVLATRNQMRRGLLLNPKFAAVSDATKQQLSDALLLQVMFNDRIITSAKTNPAQMASAKNSIRQGALAMFKVDLTKAKLTSNGLDL